MIALLVWMLQISFQSAEEMGAAVAFLRSIGVHVSDPLETSCKGLCIFGSILLIKHSSCLFKSYLP